MVWVCISYVRWTFWEGLIIQRINTCSPPPLSRTPVFASKLLHHFIELSQAETWSWLLCLLSKPDLDQFNSCTFMDPGCVTGLTSHRDGKEMALNVRCTTWHFISLPFQIFSRVLAYGPDVTFEIMQVLYSTPIFSSSMNNSLWTGTFKIECHSLHIRW